MDWKSKRVVILGLARQGVALARYLAERGARVVVSDAKPAEQLTDARQALRDLTIEYTLGGHPPTVLDGADLLCLSGGVPADVPLAQEAARRSVPISNDAQIFLDAAPCKVLGITGSAGKTTTTTLVGLMAASRRASHIAYRASHIANSGDEQLARGDTPPAIGDTPSAIRDKPSAIGRVWVGGNIGNPLIADLDQMQADDLAVMELSSFQLEIMTTSPPIAGVLNITPNHLDRHGTMDVYIKAKSHILLHQGANDIAILGRDDANTRALANIAKGRVLWFSAEGEVSAGTFLRGGNIILRDDGREQVVCAESEIKLRGAHNVLNVLAACALAGAAGVSPEATREAINNFTGVEHRLELVRELTGVKWYNDSIATAPERVIAAIRSFDEPIILLLGGRDKKLPWGELMRLARQRVKALIVFGEAAGLIAGAAEAENETVDERRYKRAPKLIRVEKCIRLADAVQKAAEIASSGDVVLLSPGCTSFDEFKDFAERGERFKEMVKGL